MKPIALALVIALLGAGSSARCSTPIRSVETLLGSFTRLDGTIDYKGLWGSLGVRSKLFQQAPFGMTGCVAVGGEPWKIVKLWDEWRKSWQYLTFMRQRAGTWAFAGSVEFRDTHYEEPSLGSRTIGGRSWLIFEHVARYGTGVFAREDVWYAVGVHLRRCDLRYLTYGDFAESGHGIDHLYSYEQSGLTTGVTNGNPFVVVSHRVRRSIIVRDNQQTVLSPAEIQTRFVWSPRATRFLPRGIRPGSLNDRVLSY